MTAGSRYPGTTQHQRPNRRHRADGTLPWPGPASLRQCGIEVRILHPYTTKQFRQPADPGNKTDDTDLSAIYRAAVNGFGLSEHEPDPIYVRLRLLARHRRRLVQNNVMLRQQMLEHLHSYMPGYSHVSRIFSIPNMLLWVARHMGSATEILQAGVRPGPKTAKCEHQIAQTNAGKDRRLGSIRTFGRGAASTPSPILH